MRTAERSRFQQSVIARSLLFVAIALIAANIARAQQSDAATPRTSDIVNNTLTPEQWQRLDETVDRGLKFLATQQAPDGSFESHDVGQPAVTSFCVMAFLSRGHLPDQGPYGKKLTDAVEYVMSTQQLNGKLAAYQVRDNFWNISGNYNHAIAGIMLGEVYGMSETEQSARVRKSIKAALDYTKNAQTTKKQWPEDDGGWRYMQSSRIGDSDLSVSAWHLMFLRSARNAQFDVPKEQIDAAVGYVRRCYHPEAGTFSYALRDYGRESFSRGMAGAGILSLALGGEHQSEMAQKAGQYLLEHPFDRFNRGGLTREDRFYYGAYYCSQGMFQLGGDYWKEFYPVLLDTLAENQSQDGSWEAEANQDGQLGMTYSTSLAILSLTPPYQLLPIFQR